MTIRLKPSRLKAIDHVMRRLYAPVEIAFKNGNNPYKMLRGGKE